MGTHPANHPPVAASVNRAAFTLLIIIACSFVLYIGYKLKPFFQPKTEIREWRRGEEGSQLVMRVCPPLYFHAFTRDDTSLRDLHHRFLFDIATREHKRLKGPVVLSYLNFEPDWNATDGRCRRISAMLDKDMSAKIPLTPADLLKEEEVLRVAVRDEQAGISLQDPVSGEWTGAAVTFAEQIAHHLKRKLVMVTISDAQDRFLALHFGIADISISLITKTPEREQMSFLSNSYFRTGLMIGTFNPEIAARRITLSQLNNSHFTAVAVANTTGHKMLLRRFPKVHIHLAENSDDIPEEVNYLRKQGYDEVIFVTDALIAARFEGAHLVHFPGGPMLTDDDDYVVAARTPALAQAVNQVIEEEGIPAMYESALTGLFSTRHTR